MKTTKLIELISTACHWTLEDEDGYGKRIAIRLNIKGKGQLAWLVPRVARVGGYKHEVGMPCQIGL